MTDEALNAIERDGSVTVSERALVAEVRRWRKALTELTPGGSEFADDPERCAQFVHDSKRAIFGQLRRRQAECEQLGADVVRLSALLESAETKAALKATRETARRSARVAEERGFPVTATAILREFGLEESAKQENEEL